MNSRVILEKSGLWGGISEDITRNMSETVNDIILGPRQRFLKLGKEAFVDLKVPTSVSHKEGQTYCCGSACQYRRQSDHEGCTRI